MSYETHIDFPVGEKYNVTVVMFDIRRKDDTFLWKVVDLKGGICRLIVKSKTRNQAERRKCWLLNRVEALEGFLSFGVKWVKE